MIKAESTDVRAGVEYTICCDSDGDFAKDQARCSQQCSVPRKELESDPWLSLREDQQNVHVPGASGICRLHGKDQVNPPSSTSVYEDSSHRGRGVNVASLESRCHYGVPACNNKYHKKKYCDKATDSDLAFVGGATICVVEMRFLKKKCKCFSRNSRSGRAAPGSLCTGPKHYSES